MGGTDVRAVSCGSYTDAASIDTDVENYIVNGLFDETS